MLAGSGLELGLGLTSIGRRWGVKDVEPPSEQEAGEVLACAVDYGIRVFDTAPSYGISEARFGRFLKSLSPSIRKGLVVMTKAGEHWDSEKQLPFVDHARDALCRSIDRSLEHLGGIDVLQLHKATLVRIRHPNVIAALDHAKACGIRHFGASVSDVETGVAAIETGLYQALQFPFNVASPQWKPLVPPLLTAAMTPIVNRPFAMGGLVQTDRSFEEAAAAAFGWIATNLGSGIVLTGTGKRVHLEANVAVFRAVTGA